MKVSWQTNNFLVVVIVAVVVVTSFINGTIIAHNETSQNYNERIVWSEQFLLIQCSCIKNNLGNNNKKNYICFRDNTNGRNERRCKCLLGTLNNELSQQHNFDWHFTNTLINYDDSDWKAFLLFGGCMINLISLLELITPNGDSNEQLIIIITIKINCESKHFFYSNWHN